MNKEHKGLSAWQLMMMALGTVIGGSFFLGSSVAIHAAGPSVIITYMIGGLLAYYILFALSEMTVADPQPGSFRTYAANQFGPGTGFVVGWVYWMGMVLGMSSEATAASILLRQWIPYLPVAWLGIGIILGVTLLNLLGSGILSKLESLLAAIKILAIVSFIIVAFLLLTGIFTPNTPVPTGLVSNEAFMPGGIKGIAGSLLIIIFAYAGFEIIGLAASETRDPVKTVPKAIQYTVISLVGLYLLSVIAILLLVPTAELTEDVSPMVAALDRRGIGWAGTALNLVLVTAILSTMLAAMFGLGRMMGSLAEKGQAPRWLKAEGGVPQKGILFSGACMLISLTFGLLLPKVYLFLISSGGFAILFTYAVIVATHIKFRKTKGCPPAGRCSIPGFPYTSWTVLLIMLVAIVSMPFIPGQGSGMIAGIFMVVLFSMIYRIMKGFKRAAVKKDISGSYSQSSMRPGFSTEFSKELAQQEEKREE